MQEQNVEQNSANRYHSAFYGREQIYRTACERHESTRNHAAVYSYQRIGVVQFHHQERGNGKAYERQPQVLLYQSAQQPYSRRYRTGYGQRLPALGNFVLKPLNQTLYS